jgi:hypothetical protein
MVMTFPNAGNAGQGRPKAEIPNGNVATPVVAGLAIGLFSILIFAAHAESFALATSVGLTVAMGAMVVGGLLGFVFAIPRALQGGDAPPTAPANRGEAHPNGDVADMRYRANTNLEQISDWLTKILVGVSLTQIPKIGTTFALGAHAIGRALDPTAGASVFAGGLLIYFLVGGFVIGYLGTRIYLPPIFLKADLSALGILRRELTESMEETINAERDKLIERQDDQVREDAEAFALVDIQLGDTHEPKFTRQQLIDTIMAASPHAKEQIFQWAKSVRHDSWRNKSVGLIERTIPVFEGLLETPIGQRRHRYHAQLGYALKDQQQPDWSAAKAHMEEAIKLSAEAGDPVSAYYSFNWAICAIEVDSREHPKGRTDRATRDEIINQLRNAAQFGLLKEAIRRDDSGCIRAWLDRNELTLESLDLAMPSGPAAPRSAAPPKPVTAVKKKPAGTGRKADRPTDEVA